MDYNDRKFDGRNKIRNLGTGRGSTYRNPREFSNKANTSAGIGRNRNYYSNDKPRSRGYLPRTANGYIGSCNDDTGIGNRQNNNAQNTHLDLKIFLPRLSHSNGKIVTMTHIYGYISAVHGELLFFPYDQFFGNICNVKVGDEVDFDIKCESNRPYGATSCRVAYNIRLATKLMEQNDNHCITADLAGNSSSCDHEIINEKPLNGHVIATTDILEEQAIKLKNSDLAIKYIDNMGQESMLSLDSEPVTKQSYCIDNEVQFNITVDENGHKRPVNILLCGDINTSSNKLKNKGVILAYGKKFGLIDSMDIDGLIYFPLKEIINPDTQVSVLDQVEFVMVTDSNTNKSSATEVKILPYNSFEYAEIDTQLRDGLVEKSCISTSSTKAGKDVDFGLISYHDDQGIVQILRYFPKDISFSKSIPEFGSKVTFNILTTKNLGKRFATNVLVSSSETEKIHRGFVATLKDNYGFLEDYDHSREIYFHYSSVKTPLQYFRVGTEVEFSLEVRNDKVCAENVMLLPPGTLMKEIISPEILNGIVERALLVPEKQGIVFEGVIKLVHQSNEKNDSDPSVRKTYSFLSSSMITSKVVLRDNEKVKFKIATNPETGKTRAVNVEPVRQLMIGKIESMKGEYGFIEYQDGESKNFFFHVNDISQANATFKVGDTVQFVIQQQRNGKIHAIQIQIISPKAERKSISFSALAISNERNNTSIIRLPKGPDGTKGFQYNRTSSSAELQELT